MVPFAAVNAYDVALEPTRVSSNDVGVTAVADTPIERPGELTFCQAPNTVVLPGDSAWSCAFEPETAFATAVADDENVVPLVTSRDVLSLNVAVARSAAHW